MTTAPEITAPATTDLVRSVPFELVRDAADPGDGLTFRGYAAVFNQPTAIDSWEGRFTEQVAPGAFKKTLREQTPVFQFDHGQHPMVGSMPLGVITEAREDDKGVFVEARLHDNWMIQPVRDAIASGAVKGMSYRFEVVRDRWSLDGKELRGVDEIRRAISATSGPMPDRTVLELKSREMGPVVFPAYAGTSATVRSMTIDLSRPLDDDDRRTLAHIVFAADAATQDTPETPEDTSQEAADHAARDDDTPQGTADTAAEHESEEPDGLREEIRRWRELHAPTIRHALEGAPRYE